MKRGHKIAIGIGVGGATALGIGYLLTRKAPPLEPADFTVSDLVISPTQCYPGEQVLISVIVTNIGQTSGQATISAEVT